MRALGLGFLFSCIRARFCMFLTSFVSVGFIFFVMLLSPAISAKCPQSLGRMGWGGGGGEWD